MAVITNTISGSHPKQLRPFDMRRDMEAVADLIESCFSSTLDPDGKRYLRQMRAVARRRGITRWTSIAASTNTLPFAGFVWEEAGEVVGNLSLVPFIFQGRRIYLIANVAVAAEYRRRGIAQALTTAALERCRQRHVSSTWLQVRSDNQAAIDLYLARGFTPRARRTTWVINPMSIKGEAPAGMRVRARRSPHWSPQKAWLEQNYPTCLRWHFPLRMALLRPGFWGWMYRFFNEVDLRHWAVESGKDLIGILSWQRSGGYSDHLWLAALPEHDELVLGTVLPFIRRGRILSRPISLNFPEGRAAEVLSAAGFEHKDTLIWMEVKHDREIF